MKRITSLILVLVMLCSALLIGCDGCNEEVIDYETIEFSDTLVYDGKKSDYKIVIPEDATEYEQFASEELVTFFEEGTGIKLEVITDEGLTHSAESKYFSLGRTTLLASTDIEVSYDELGRDGYKMVSKDDTLYICGGDGYGTVYGVYKYLEVSLGWLPLAPDEIIVNTVPRLYLPECHFIDIPDLENRTGGHYVTAQNERLFAMRSRTFAGHGYGLFHGDVWGIWAHTHFSLLPLGTYGDLHPEWYSADKLQLCLSNTEMRAQMVEAVKERIINRPDAELFMIGQEDSAVFCTCEACTKNMEAIGDVSGDVNGARSALMMDFINDVATQIEEWRKENCPERKILIGTFAYQRTEAPPAKKNDNGEYEMYSIPSVLYDSVRDASGNLKTRTVTYNTVKAKDNVFVLIAPIYADWASPINDPDHNGSTKIILEGWHASADKLAVWAYCNNFNMYLEYFDNINSWATNYQVYEELGVFYVYDESGQSGKANMMWQTMMNFVKSQIMWNNEANVDALITKFMKGYYKEAYEPMRKLFDLIRNYFTTRKAQLEEEKGSYIGTGIWLGDANKAELSKDFWQLGVLEQMIEYTEEAHELIDKAVYDDADRETMHLRITQESLTPRFYMLQLFSADIEKSVYFSLVDEFEADMAKLGIATLVKGKTVAATAAQWRASKM